MAAGEGEGGAPKPSSKVDTTSEQQPATTDDEKTNNNNNNDSSNIEFVNYEDESQLEAVMNLVLQDLSEPYSSKFAACIEYFAFVCVYVLQHGSL